ncbi:MAG: T9SS C-terminal target domain-containing protein [Bacteroidetes bacterium]|nr:MAG: T9SS C-terminal target domain-containing protein [Bacteroidota bacterium]
MTNREVGTRRVGSRRVDAPGLPFVHRSSNPPITMKHGTAGRLVLLLLGWSLLALPPDVHAQDVPTTSVDFRATSASIAEGATSVALDATLTFTLDKPLPDEATLMEFSIESIEDLIIGAGEDAVVGSSVSGDRREVTYQLALDPSTDYAIGFWGFTYVYNGVSDWTYGFNPFAVNFTTAEAFGDATLTGTLYLDPVTYPDVNPDFTSALVIITGVDHDNDYLSVVADVSNQYTVNVVRPGSYSIQALYYGPSTEAPFQAVFGAHDGDGDGVTFFENPLEFLEDAVVVAAGATVTADIEMAGYFFEVGTAAEGAPERPGTVLGPGAPNPVQTRTTIPFELSAPQPVRLAVYDVLGREVAVLVDGVRAAGRHAAVFEAAHLPSGLYLVRLETPQGSRTRSLVVTR